MAERRPLVLVNGDLQELPSGDTLPGAGGLQNNLAATAAPTVSNDNTEGYAVGSRWVDVTNDNTYTCVDTTTGAAVWVQENGAGGGGSSTFTGLSDTPADFTGQALKALRVNAGETALEFTDFPVGGGGSSTPNGYRYFRWTFATSGLMTVGDIAPVGLDISGATKFDSGNFYGTETEAFDGNAATFWGHNAAAVKEDIYVGFDLGEGNEDWFDSFTIQARSSSGDQADNMTTLYLQGSNDNSTWVDIQEWDTSGSEFDYTNSETKTFTITAIQPGEFQVDIPNSSHIGKALKATGAETAEWSGNLVPENTIGDANKVLKISADGTSYGWEHSGLRKFSRWRWRFTEAGAYAGGAMGEITPYDTTGAAIDLTGGTASAYDETYGAADNLFSGTSADWAGSGNIGSVTVWAQYDFAEPVWIETYDMTSRTSPNGSQSSVGWVMEYWDFDTEAWVTVDTVSGESTWGNEETRSYISDLTQPNAEDEPIMLQTSNNETSYTVTDKDLQGNRVKKFTSSSAITITVPSGLTGKELWTVIGAGTGTITFAAGGGVTIHSLNGNLDIAGQYGSASLIPDHENADTYFLVGALA